MSTTLARRERHALCDLALELGGGAATLCGDWTAADLVSHLWVREHRPDAAIGAFVGPLAFLSDAAMARARRTPFETLVAKVRDPGLTPFALRPVEVLANTMEFVVHHEDLRRGHPAWEPRVLAPDDLDQIWRALGRMGRLLVRGVDVPVTVRRDDTGQEHTVRGGGEPVVISGPVVEVAMLMLGRSEVRDVEVTGPADLVARWEDAERRF